MPLITPEEARLHLRSEPADDADVALKTRAAERAAMRFLNRVVYEDDGALALGRTEADAEIAAAYTAYVAAQGATYEAALRNDELRRAKVAYNEALEAALEKRNGIVINEDIKIGMLIILGALFLKREDADIPDGARHYLQTYRRGLGV